MWVEDPAVYGCRAAGRCQSRRDPGRTGAAREERIPGRDACAMAGGDRLAGARSSASPAHGPGRATVCRDHLRRGGRSDAVASSTGWTQIAETSGVSNGALKLTELTSAGVRWQVLPEWRHLLFGSNGLRLD